MSAKGAKRPNRSAKKIATKRSKKRSPGGGTTARSKKSSGTSRTPARPETRRSRNANPPLAASPIKFGLRLPSFALGARTATLAEMGAYLRRAEDLGFDSAVSIDHLLLTPPAYACTWLEPVALLAALAGVTRTIKLGTMVLVLPLRNPAYFAKEWATLDLVSGGRSILGVGVGWHEEEFGLMGVPHKERGRRMDEMLEAVTALWAGDRVSYDGKYYKFRDLTIDPKPLQKPHPPIWIGGGSQPFEKVYGQTVTNIDPVLRRIAKYARTWVPHSSATADMVKGDWEKIQRFMGDFGRRPGDMSKVYSNFVWVLEEGREAGERDPPLQDLLGDGSALLARVLSAGRSRGAGREDLAPRSPIWAAASTSCSIRSTGAWSSSSCWRTRCCRAWPGRDGRVSAPPPPRYLGAHVKRLEDSRLLAGRGVSSTTSRLPGLLHAGFVRSTHAHAIVRAVDAEAARDSGRGAGAPAAISRARWRRSCRGSTRPASRRPCGPRSRTRGRASSASRWPSSRRRAPTRRSTAPGRRGRLRAPARGGRRGGRGGAGRAAPASGAAIQRALRRRATAGATSTAPSRPRR